MSSKKAASDTIVSTSSEFKIDGAQCEAGYAMIAPRPAAFNPENAKAFFWAYEAYMSSLRQLCTDNESKEWTIIKAALLDLYVDDEENVKPEKILEDFLKRPFKQESAKVQLKQLQQILKTVSSWTENDKIKTLFGYIDASWFQELYPSITGTETLEVLFEKIVKYAEKQSTKSEWALEIQKKFIAQTSVNKPDKQTETTTPENYGKPRADEKWMNDITQQMQRLTLLIEKKDNYSDRPPMAKFCFYCGNEDHKMGNCQTRQSDIDKGWVESRNGALYHTNGGPKLSIIPGERGFRASTVGAKTI
ncbi:hypothetical protein H4219_006403 [Mycoemilia scoparia]|uniref:Uncharacterized protein n=1 Tax=Mycoemilia scoparia TaxID=417184 RepID=A0A9W7ZSK1_9FUNG|nr:hypothetical protein H4219_006403 [Mycoemilia scoparia]